MTSHPKTSHLSFATVSFACFGSALVVIACSGGADNANANSETSAGGSAATCESTGKKLCERACACGPKCKTAFRGASGAVTTLTWSDRGDCEAAFVGSRCGSGGPVGVDYTQCDADIASAACESEAFVDPASCETRKDAG